MQPVMVWLRGELRARWKALAGVALLLGLAGGTVIASAAGARRTDTAYERFLVAQNAADATILDDGSIGIDVDLDRILALPQVSSYARGSLITFVKAEHAAVASVDDRLGRTINKFKVIDGRMYDSSKVEEVVVGFGVARQMGVEVGSRFPVQDAFDEDLAKTGLPNTTLEVVGIVAGPGEFPPQYRGLYPSIHYTPAFFKRYGNMLSSGDGKPERGSLFVKLKRGASDFPDFSTAVQQIAPGQPIDPTSSREIGLATDRTFHFQAIGLWLLAGFGGLATVLIGGQSLARQAFLGSADFATLSALGFRRSELVAIGVLRAAAVGVASAAVAVVVAIALSPLAPVGDARIAEPDPGVALDATAFVIGAAILILATVVLAAVPAWNASRVRAGIASDDAEATSSRSRVAALLARAAAPVSGVAGARFAFEKGRGRTAVPVRSTIAGAAFGLAVLIAALTFGASLDNLISTPELYGTSWDSFLTHYGEGPDLREDIPGLLATPGVGDITIAGDLPLLVGGEQLLALGVRKLRGDVGPPIVAGSEPRAPNEIALTSRTARRIRARTGDVIRVKVAVEAAPFVAFKVVGRTVIPPFGLVNAAPGEGALLTLDGMTRLIPPEFLSEVTIASDAMVRFTPGADRKKVIASLAPFFGRQADEFGEGPNDTPADIISFGRVQNLPLILGVILGVVAAATLAHTTASSVRRRRRDLAILKTLGFERRQLRATVAWQATALTVVAAIIAVPGGIALGRWTWQLLADQISVVPRPVVPAAVLAVIGIAAIILANVIAAIPGRTAARVQPARILRTE